MKRYFFSIIMLTFVLAVFISGVIIDPSGVGSMVIAKNDDRQTDRLYRKLGVLKIPRILPPGDVRLNNLDGKLIHLSDFNGKIVFLNFWTTWCPDCLFEMPSIEKLHAQLKDRDFVIIAVSLQEPGSRVKDFVKKFNLTFTILLDTDGKIGRQFGIRSIPTTFVLDRDGGIIGKVFGAREWHSKKSIAFFRHLIDKEEL